MCAEGGALGAREAERALALAEEAARAAGALLLEHLGRIDPGEVRTKSSRRDLVTRADVASERLLVGRIRSAFPGHAIEAEEEVHDPGDGGGPRWFLDPLDGTVNFVHGIPSFAVSVALFVGGNPEVACVHAPALGETFSARRGAGARLGGRPIRTTSTRDLRDALLATGFPYRRADLAEDNLENFARLYHGVRDLRRMGAAALDLAYTAAGRFDGFWELHLSPHDVAAGALLVREAGGVVTDLDGGEDWLRGGTIVAGGPRVHAALRQRLRGAGETPG